MALLKYPHTTAGYLCPINGLCDIYEKQIGIRPPDQLLFSSSIGFQLISTKKATPPKMVFFSNGSIGKRQYTFLQDFLSYQLQTIENRSFSFTLKKAKEEIDKGNPVLLFGLDMYYLPYHVNFYKKVHIAGHVNLMVGYDQEGVFVHDNDSTKVCHITFTDLEKAWGAPYLNISKPNTMFVFHFAKSPPPPKEFFHKLYAHNAKQFLAPPVSFMGQKGLQRFIKEFSHWHKTFSCDILREIYLHIITFTASTIPELTTPLLAHPTGVNNPHKAGRDKLAKAFQNHCEQFGEKEWEKAAQLFYKSGNIIEEVVENMTQDVINNSFSNSDKYTNLLKQFLQLEIGAFSILNKT